MQDLISISIQRREWSGRIPSFLCLSSVVKSRWFCYFLNTKSIWV